MQTYPHKVFNLVGWTRYAKKSDHKRWYFSYPKWRKFHTIEWMIREDVIEKIAQQGKERFGWIENVSSVQSLSRVRLFATPWNTARQASLSITNPRSPSKSMSIESVRPSNHLIFCCPLLLLPSFFPSIRVFSNESTLRMRWPKYWSFNLSIFFFYLPLNFILF